ncbi:DUF4397 domain-containing protein [Chitinophaga polysaccharea]|uniref:DUF4397 domain-containing protein n=1 Tax=Chitinophaga polysaccharea TaxID=1293035 RepID=UPI00115A4328|nr:DUF4397 domain-containing protein [Chitinophaga polysaccharea]
MKKNFTFVALLLGSLLAGGCMKKKEDARIPFLDVTNTTASGIRMFNFASGVFDGTEVTISNVPLTSYKGQNNNTGSGTPLGLSLFPSGIWTSGDNGNPFSVPASLLDKEGKAHIVFSSLGGSVLLDTVIADDVVHPKDYYLLRDNSLKVLERDNIPSARAGYFKLRVINFGNPLPGILGLNGPVSLTYADGSLVDPLLSNIMPGSIGSYIELPFGAYQFKMFLANGSAVDVRKQLAEKPLYPYINSCDPSDIIQQGILPQLRTFKAGGVYSIVVTENYYKSLTCDKQSGGAIVNGYRVITELSPAPNYVFARMQAVNAMPGKQVTISVDGHPLGGQLAYIGQTSPGKLVQPPGDMYVQGNHHVQVTDASGKELVNKNITLYPGDHYTIWACEQPDGRPGILFEANEMTGTLYTSSYHPDGPGGGVIPDDGTNGGPRRTRYPYAWESRFLNLSPDLPYATFTNSYQLFLPAARAGFEDTMRYTAAYVNLPSCVQPLQDVSMIYSLPFIGPFQPDAVNGNSEISYFPRQIRVYQSVSGPAPEIPGAVIPDIIPLDTKQAFIANDNLYTDPRFKNPETGVYTVAVVGRTSKTAPAAEKARIIVIKHNK